MRKFHEDLNAKTKGHQNGHLGKSVEHLEKQCEECANEINDLQLQNITGLDGCQNQVPAKGDTLSSKSAVSLIADKRQAVVTEQEDLQRHITNAQEVQGHALSIDSEEAGARMSSTSNYNTRLRTKNPYTSPTISQLRRIKVPWSVEEEEMLKVPGREFKHFQKLMKELFHGSKFWNLVVLCFCIVVPQWKLRINGGTYVGDV